MIITSLVDDVSVNGYKSCHGLSLFIQTDKSKILFDLGQDDTLFYNAEKAKVDLSSIDMVIISHGHYDHGGALKRFLEINSKAKVYIKKTAFEPYFSIARQPIKYIGLDPLLKDNERIVYSDNLSSIDEQIKLWSVTDNAGNSPANKVLLDSTLNADPFLHEQNAIITDGKSILLSGCSHNGIINILKEATAYGMDYVIGGFHLTNPTTGQCVPESYLDEVVNAINQYPYTTFLTCHCTGRKAFEYISKRCKNVKYFACGESISI